MEKYQVMPYQVTANRVHLRKDPALNGKMDGGVLQKGDKVESFKVSGDLYWQKVRREDGVSGWIAQKHLVCLTNDANIQKDEEFPWMAVAIRELGVRDYVGLYDNPRVVDYLNSTSVGKPHNQDDPVNWASAFVNWCIEKAECYGTDSAWGKSWLEWGEKVEAPRRGCIAIFRVRNGAHVGFVVEEKDDQIIILGANQSDSVSYQAFSKAEVSCYRAPL